MSGLGFTRDPYLMTGIDNMWVTSASRNSTCQRVSRRWCAAASVSSFPICKALVARLRNVAGLLAGTRFSFTEQGDHVDTMCPWGNRIRCHAPDARSGRRTLGMPYVQFDAPGGKRGRHCRVLSRDPRRASGGEGIRTAVVAAGARQSIRFRQTGDPLLPYDGHHMQIYLADFSGPYQRLLARDLVTLETDQHEYRFIDIVDLHDATVKFKVEHEIRSMRHPLFGRPLVNRNPAQTNRAYVRGQDAFNRM